MDPTYRFGIRDRHPAPCTAELPRCDVMEKIVTRFEQILGEQISDMMLEERGTVKLADPLNRVLPP
jgi:hypothetical protein